MSAMIAVAFLLIFFAIVLAIKSIVVVPNQFAVVVERLGKFHSVFYAGFHFLIPFFDVIAYRRSLKEQVLDVPKQTCITKDNVTVSIDGVIYLQVLDVAKSAYGISDFQIGAVQLAQTSMRSVIGKLDLDRTFEERERINREVVEALDAATMPWGVKVLRYEIRDITPPPTIMGAMEQQVRAEREKRALIAQSEGEMQSRINLAEGEKQAAIARAEGEKQANIARSEGEKQAVINKAQGEAEQILALATATAQGLQAVGKELAGNEGVSAAQLRLAEGYIAQFGNLARQANSLVIPANIADVSGMVATLARIIKPGQGLDASRRDTTPHNDDVVKF